MTYTPALLPEFVATCDRQRPKDERFVKQVLPWLRSGRVLEIGAGCAQLSELLAQHGVDVMASDIEPFFVDYQKQIGLESLQVNAMDIVSDVGKTFDNIITQGVSTLVTKDLDMVRTTYASVWNALNPAGRLIFIFPNAYQRPGKPWSTIDDHWPLIEEAGFDVVKRFRHQLFPSQWYHHLSPLVTQPLEKTIGQRWGMRNIFVLEKPAASRSAAA